MTKGPERDLTRRYLERFEVAGRQVGLIFSGVTEVREGRAAEVPARLAEESALLGRWRDEGRALIVLDESGRTMTSRAFAEVLSRLRDDGVADCVMAIGGPDGHDPAILPASRLLLSFGRQTWPHQLARVMLAEQLYRAATILAGHPYHRD
jgi:23S rRNA (pseudouridine1915-N3)-methyltransferase